jgi:C_GCAxxG_C_C family probable redox protein
MAVGVEAAVDLFESGHSCSEAVFLAYAPSLGLDPDDSKRRLASALASQPQTCGALTAATLVIGLHAESTAPGDREERTTQLVQQLTSSFRSHLSTAECATLVGCDLSTPEGQAAYAAKSLPEPSCVRFVREAAMIVEELLG